MLLQHRSEPAMPKLSDLNLPSGSDALCQQLPTLSICQSDPISNTGNIVSHTIQGLSALPHMLASDQNAFSSYCFMPVPLPAAISGTVCGSEPGSDQWLNSSQSIFSKVNGQEFGAVDRLKVEKELTEKIEKQLKEKLELELEKEKLKSEHKRIENERQLVLEHQRLLEQERKWREEKWKMEMDRRLLEDERRQVEELHRKVEEERQQLEEAQWTDENQERWKALEVRHRAEESLDFNSCRDADDTKNVALVTRCNKTAEDGSGLMGEKECDWKTVGVKKREDEAENDKDFDQTCDRKIELPLRTDARRSNERFEWLEKSDAIMAGTKVKEEKENHGGGQRRDAEKGHLNSRSHSGHEIKFVPWNSGPKNESSKSEEHLAVESKGKCPWTASGDVGGDGSTDTFAERQHLIRQQKSEHESQWSTQKSQEQSSKKVPSFLEIQTEQAQQQRREQEEEKMRKNQKEAERKKEQMSKMANRAFPPPCAGIQKNSAKANDPLKKRTPLLQDPVASNPTKAPYLMSISVVPPAKDAEADKKQLFLWCQSTLPLKKLPVDISTLIDLLIDIESTYEVHDYVRQYLGESPQAKDFTRRVLDWKQKHKANRPSSAEPVKSDSQPGTRRGLLGDGPSLLGSPVSLLGNPVMGGPWSGGRGAPTYLGPMGYIRPGQQMGAMKCTQPFNLYPNNIYPNNAYLGNSYRPQTQTAKGNKMLR